MQCQAAKIKCTGAPHYEQQESNRNYSPQSPDPELLSESTSPGQSIGAERALFESGKRHSGQRRSKHQLAFSN